ncbi:membrane protein [Vibrio galatheae]|uniref:Membrane protein n=1 Tax=Vibrio galatheae TaxID=579748 RepID=A0A0F4NJZ5_9VIBR|nr:rhombosortase [Vibrio galatheae]KJY83480.1 membrane protein [Vibrio galatheae]
MRLLFLLIAISLVCLGLQFEPFASQVNWQRTLIVQGQWWRILAGNFTHTNFAHLVMNLAGLWVISFIFKPSPKSLILCLCFASLAVGVLNFLTTMNGYVGLSGALHGLFAYFALQEVFDGRKSSWLLVIGVLAKVVWEMTMGAAVSTSELINARVAVESHLFGALAGFILALTQLLLRKKGLLSHSES